MTVHSLLSTAVTLLIMYLHVKSIQDQAEAEEEFLVGKEFSTLFMLAAVTNTNGHPHVALIIVHGIPVSRDKLPSLSFTLAV